MLGSLIDAGARLMGRDRRQYERLPAVLPASVTVSGYSYPCTTVDLSEGGAQLYFPSALDVAGIIELRVPSLHMKKQARVAWRDEGRMGVEFVP